MKEGIALQFLYYSFALFYSCNIFYSTFFCPLSSPLLSPLWRMSWNVDLYAHFLLLHIELLKLIEQWKQKSDEKIGVDDLIKISAAVYQHLVKSSFSRKMIALLEQSGFLDQFLFYFILFYFIFYILYFIFIFIIIIIILLFFKSTLACNQSTRANIWTDYVYYFDDKRKNS